MPTNTSTRILSGMRPTGRLHLGHYHGVLENWLKLQHEYQCFFFVADWHALTTHYDDPSTIEQHTWDMVVDWLACGLDPQSNVLFIQSQIPEHAELCVLLSMITPLSWLERVPSYKDQQQNFKQTSSLKDKDLATYGFLGYPVLQSADILAYRAGLVPVGEDQVAHVEFTRELARRFNHLYGKEPDYELRALEAVKKLNKKNATLYEELRNAYLEKGNEEALHRARALLNEQVNISLGDKERLYGYLEGGGKIILPEPQAMLTEAAKVPGLDGRKMSKSYDNVIALRDPPNVVEQKLRTMPTDPARVRRQDPGNPEKCPVWPLHKIHSDEKTRAWVQEGCTSAGIGCVECKQPVIESVLKKLEPIQTRAQDYTKDMIQVKNIIAEGCRKAREIAADTLHDVRENMGLGN